MTVLYGTAFSTIHVYGKRDNSLTKEHGIKNCNRKKHEQV